MTEAGAGRSIGAVRPFLLYVAFALVGGALLAYPLYVATGSLLDYPFHRVVSRAVMLAALVGLPVLLRVTGAGNRRSQGFDCPRPVFLRQAGIGFGLGLLTALPLVTLLMLLGVRVWDPEGLAQSAGAHLVSLLVLLLSAIAVGLLEEWLFRGALFGALRSRAGAWTTIWLTSLLYAVAHFLQFRGGLEGQAPDWTSGVFMLAGGLGRLFPPDGMMDAFVALLLLGLLLGMMRERIGHIGLCAGMHAGWVWVLRVGQDLGDVDYDNRFAFLVSDRTGMLGYLGIVWFGLIVAGYGWYIARQRNRASDI